MKRHPPFYDVDPMGIYMKIVRSVIQFPKFISLRAKDLVRKLLNPNITFRLGCSDVNYSYDIKLFRNCETNLLGWIIDQRTQVV